MSRSGERVTSDGLDWGDETIDALPVGLRVGLGAFWEERARSELRVAHAFRLVGVELEATGVSEVVRGLVAEAIEDEERHAGLCHRLAERYAGRAVAPLAIEAVLLPSFQGASDDLRVALHVATLSCINETIATAWLGGCFARATAPLAREATRLHLREEIGHARLGWAHLASGHVSRASLAALGKWLPRLLEANVPQWFRADPALPPEGAPEHGALAVAETRALVLDAVREVVLPGFEEVGVDASAGHAWAAEQG